MGIKELSVGEVCSCPVAEPGDGVMLCTEVWSVGREGTVGMMGWLGIVPGSWCNRMHHMPALLWGAALTGDLGSGHPRPPASLLWASTIGRQTGRCTPGSRSLSGPGGPVRPTKNGFPRWECGLVLGLHQVPVCW